MSMIPVPAQYNPHWQFFVTPDGHAKLFTGEPIKNVIRRRQDLPPTYIRNGYFWIFKPHLLFEDEPSFYGTDARAYLMDGEYDIDIDVPEDWEKAEQKFERLKNYGK